MLRRLWNKSSYAHLVTRSFDGVHTAPCTCGWVSNAWTDKHDLDVEIANHAGFTL